MGLDLLDNMEQACAIEVAGSEGSYPGQGISIERESAISL
jgi:hypothetical protein